MLVVFLPIFADTESIYGYNFVAPLFFFFLVAVPLLATKSTRPGACPFPAAPAPSLKTASESR